ncbi:hypothetical protein B0I31_108284 [Saccharothrix carnea]|uniref:ClpA/ClpB-like protein n=1 Tax=Saccharothrix carnea TaxID=1280637 RepID=A0A2P8I5V6_SACCR|nr:hypothetical protein [Saccharothrix carnea]PSL53837.1 hypothetical protein B0I31_108284 [Saccharothrix carnea]
MRMRIRTRLVAAVLTAGTLTAVVAASTSPALAEPATAKGVTAEHEPAKQKPAEDEVVKKGSGKPDKPGNGQHEVPEEAVKLLAVKLGITVDRSRQVYRDLQKVKSRGAEIVGDRAFVAIAEGLGITPERLLAVLREVKQEIAVPPKPKPGEPVGPPSK